MFENVHSHEYLPGHIKIIGECLFHLVVVFLDDHLEVQPGKLAQVSVGPRFFGSEHRTHLQRYAHNTKINQAAEKRVKGYFNDLKQFGANFFFFFFTTHEKTLNNYLQHTKFYSRLPPSV